jgi:hypothetical protein
MARELGERLLATLRRVEQLFEGSAVSASSAEGDPTNAPQPQPGQEVQALDNDAPRTTGEKDPPFGQDRRYWLDVTKIIHVPAGQLAPAGTIDPPQPPTNTHHSSSSSIH